MAGLQPYHHGTLTEKDKDFERQRFEHYVAMRATHLDRRALEAWELYHNDRDGTQTQYTREQIEMLQQVGAPQVSMNYIYPIMSTAKAVLTNDRPTGRVMPAWGEMDKRVAAMYDNLISAIWRKSKGDALYRNAVKESMITYYGVMGAFPSTYYRRGKFNLVFDHISWQDFYIDPNAKLSGLCFEDAEAMYIGRLIPKRKCQRIYGYVPDETGEELKTDTMRGPAPEEENDPILVRNVYEKVDGIYCLFEIPDPVNRTTFKTRRVFETERQLSAFQQRYGAVLRDWKEGVYVRLRTILGMDYLFEEHLLPLTVYPFAIFTPDDYQNPYGKSPVEYLREPQKAANKFTQTTILNAQLASNARFMGPAGSFVDKDAWTKYGAAAGSTYEYKADPNLPDGGKPTIIQPLPLASAWYQLGGFMKGYMEYNAGLPAFMQGDPSQAPETASASLQAGSYGSIRPRDLRARYELAMTYLYKAAIEYVNFYADRQEIIRYLDDRDEYKEIPLAQILDDNQIIEHDVYMGQKTSLPSDRAEMKQTLMTALQQTADPEWQKMIFEELLDYTDMPVADRMREKIDTLKNLNATNQQLQKQLEEYDALVKRLANEVIMGKKQAAVAKLDGDMKAISADTKARTEVALAKIKQGEVEDAEYETIEEL